MCCLVLRFSKEKEKGQVRRMELGMIHLLKMKQGEERILHVPGNYKGGILEMALVIDCNLDRQKAKENVQAIVKALKSHSETFRNVRLNVVWWKSDEEIITEVMPMTVLQIGTPFESYEKMAAQKRIDGLFANLKMFQARSKLILLLSDGQFGIEQEENCMESLKPFLGRKMLLMLDEVSEEIERLALKARMITLEV